jgi:hypothetical protein
VNAVIRVYDEAGNMIEMHESAGDFRELLSRFRRSKEVIKTVDISIDRFHFAHRRSYIALSNFDAFSFCSRPFASELFFCDATGGCGS